VHVGGGGVARLTGVDHDHRAPLAPELEGGGESGGRSADDGDVAVALDCAGRVFTHGFDDTLEADECKAPCGIRKTRPDEAGSDGRAERD
jgi:hypothetical protein